MPDALLDIRGLSVRFKTPEGIGRAVESVDLSLAPGETLGLVGESGCGKTVTAMAVMGLVPSPPGRVTGEAIRFDGQNLLDADSETRRRIRGRDMGMIFQEPMTALNPVLTIGRQVSEPLMVHLGLSKKEALAKAARWLDRVRIPSSKSRLESYPHELSGGMRQRVMIAMAMICRPRLLIADEPTTALDVTTQRQILALMASLKDELNTAMLMITHDLGVVAQTAGQMAVMYAGRIVEIAQAKGFHDHCKHPYTRALVDAVPQPNPKNPLPPVPVEGEPPDPSALPSGCTFHPRCPYRSDPCVDRRPPLTEVKGSHVVACWLNNGTTINGGQL